MKHRLRQLPGILLLIVTALPVRLLSQTGLDHHSTLETILSLEAYAIGSGVAAESKDGAQVVGALDGISGLALVAEGVIGKRVGDIGPGMRVPAVVAGAGYMALSYYNFATATSQLKKAERGRVNFLGVNAVGGLVALSSAIFRPHTESDNSVTFGVTPSGVRWDIRF